jgi:TIR domain
MAEVFISYARTDQGFARDLNAALQKINRDTWIDWRSIPESAEWRAEIFAAIEAADNFLFVISPDSVKSWMCGQEVAHAAANGRRELAPHHKYCVPFRAAVSSPKSCQMNNGI